MYSWDIAEDYRRVRAIDPTLIAPCGCVDAKQMDHCFDMKDDNSPGYLECLGCGAVFDNDDISDWERL